MSILASKSQKTNQTGELALIENIRQRAMRGHKSPTLTLGIGDDCAIVRPPAGHEVLVTTDFSLEGRHFRRDWHSPQSIGHRTLARGLSDLASMGAEPMSAFLSLALPKAVARNRKWIDGFLDGFLSLAKASKVPLAGGDTSESPSEHVLADVVLLGSAPAGAALQRSGANAGDILYCTGSLGGSATQFGSVAAGKRVRHQLGGMHPHFFPAPRLGVGLNLRERRLATACIDLSDGLSTDLTHLCAASRVCAEIEADALPLHDLTQSLESDDALTAALHGGEDYELLFAANASTKVPKRIAGVPITRIGRLIAQRKGLPRITLLREAGAREVLEPAGWEHLR